LPTISKSITINANQPEADLITKAADELAKGKVGIFPTHCLYGIGTNAFDQLSIERIFAIKKRPFDKPLLVLISHLAQLNDLTVNIPPIAHELMRLFWPGQVTFLLKARSGLPKGIVGPDHKIGVRLAGSSIAAALVTQAGMPIIGTSANLSGQPGCYRLDQMEKAILTAVDVIIDAGTLAGGIGSSVVDATRPIPCMLRKGSLSEKKFKKALAKL
jgi:L-threonylcarbamoyladenylate synthase